MPTVPQLKNPTLQWDNQTPILHGVPVQRPTGWHINQPEATHRDNTLGVFDRVSGFGIDAGDKTGTLVLYQRDIHFPAGTYALRVDLFSHVQRQGAYDAKWQFAIVHNDKRIVSKEELWVDNRKGFKPLVGVISTPHAFTGTLELHYIVRYASVKGEMQIQRVRFSDNIPPLVDFRIAITGGDDVEGGVNITQEDYADMMHTLSAMEAMQTRLRDLLTGL